MDKEWEKLEKISACNLTKVKSKKQVIDEARTSVATVHFASLMDICHLKNAELEAKHQKYKGRVVLRGDIVKDNSGSYAVFTEQGSSASQRTAAKIIDIISRLPGCDGQAADAVSAYTQVKMEDAHKLLKIPKSEVSRQLDSSTTTQMAKIMVQYGRPSCSSSAECILGLHSMTMRNKTKIMWTITGPCLNREFLRLDQRNYHFLKIFVFLRGLMQQLYKVSTPCIEDHHFKEEETKSVGELSNTCSQIVLKCLHLARIGRPDILWSVNKLARAITKLTKACDKRLNRLISYIHHTK